MSALFGDRKLSPAVAFKRRQCVNRHQALRPAGAGKMLITPTLLGEVLALVNRHITDELKDPVREIGRVRAVVRKPEFLQRVRKSHDAKTNGAVFPFPPLSLF